MGDEDYVKKLIEGQEKYRFDRKLKNLLQTAKLLKRFCFCKYSRGSFWSEFLEENKLSE